MTSDELAEPGNLAISCRVNGAVVQAARTSDMFFVVAALSDGDEVIVAIDGIGELVNICRFERP